MTEQQNAVTDAEAYLAEAADRARTFAADAAAYLDVIRETPRPASVARGDFFLTLDGSVVTVVGDYHAGDPVGGGDHTIAAAIKAMSLRAGVGPAPAVGFVCCVVRGGHGHAGLYGSGPGEQYVVARNGLTVMSLAVPRPAGGDPDAEDDEADGGGGPAKNPVESLGVLATSSLRCVGLSLKEKVDALFPPRAGAGKHKGA